MGQAWKHRNRELPERVIWLLTGLPRRRRPLGNRPEAGPRKGDGYLAWR